MEPAFFPCFQMNIFQIPFLLLMNLDLLQIIFLRVFGILGIQFPKDTNILPDLFNRNAQQLFRIRADIICLIGFGIQHQENVIHVHWKLLEQFITVQNLRILFPEVRSAFLNNKTDKECGNAEYNHTDKEYRTTLQTVHTGIDDICLDKSQKYPVLDIRFFIDQIIVSSIQIQQHRVGTSCFKLLWKFIDLFFRHIRMLSQNTEKIIHIPPCFRRMIDHNTAIRMNNKTLGISIESRNIQYIYDIRVFISNGYGIIFKSLISSVSLRSGKNKQLRFSGNWCIRNNIISLPDLLFNIFL